MNVEKKNLRLSSSWTAGDSDLGGGGGSRIGQDQADGLVDGEERMGGTVGGRPGG